MTLRQSTLISDGSGRLFAAPFLSGCLLYHLQDVNCSLLVYHRQLAEAANDSSRSGATAFHFDVTVHEPTEVIIHYTVSTDGNLDEMYTRPSVQISLPTSQPVTKTFAGAILSLEPVQLPRSEMLLMFGCGRSLSMKYDIEDTDYCARTSCELSRLGLFAPKACTCWRVSVYAANSKRKYDVTWPCNWSLTALQLDDDRHVVSEMRLERREGSR